MRIVIAAVVVATLLLAPYLGITLFGSADHEPIAGDSQ